MKHTKTPVAESAPIFSGRDLFKIIFPLIIQQILSITIGTADSMMVAHAGEAAVSGVSLVNTLDTLLVLVFTSLVSGGSVVVSQALGRKDYEGARASTKQLLYSTTAIATAVTAGAATIVNATIQLDCSRPNSHQGCISVHFQIEMRHLITHISQSTIERA
jgi:Na+-driven multidrug efflux pump